MIVMRSMYMYCIVYYSRISKKGHQRFRSTRSDTGGGKMLIIHSDKYHTSNNYYLLFKCE